MYKFTSSIKHKCGHFIPLFMTLVFIGVSYAMSVLDVAEKYCDYDCRVGVWEPILTFAVPFLPGAISLLFVRTQIIRAWSFFALPYLLLVTIFLSQQSVGGVFGSGERAWYSIMFGLFFSLLTILWAIAHSFAIRRGEKI